MQVNVYSSQPSDRSDGLDGAGNDALLAGLIPCNRLAFFFVKATGQMSQTV